MDEEKDCVKKSIVKLFKREWFISDWLVGKKKNDNESRVCIIHKLLYVSKNLHNINGTHEHAKYHMHDTEDDGQLHFVRI